MKKYVILALAVFVLIKVLPVRVIDVRVSRVCPIVATSEVITPKETDVFLKQWAEYVKRGYRAKVPENFLADEVNMADRLPWQVRFWMESKCIDPKRFFYVEQRIRSILKAEALKKHTDGVAAILSAQMNAGMNEEKQKWYQDLIEKQQKLPKIEGVTDEELEMFNGREDEIEALLK